MCSHDLISLEFLFFLGLVSGTGQHIGLYHRGQKKLLGAQDGESDPGYSKQKKFWFERKRKYNLG